MKLKVEPGECKNNILPVVPLPMLIALDPFRSKRPTPPFLFEKKEKKKRKMLDDLSLGSKNFHARRG